MKLPWTRTENRSSNAGQQIVDLLSASARGVDSAEVAQTAAAEFGVGLMSRGLSSAEVTPEKSPLTPSLLGMIGRELLTRGAFCAGIKIARGKATLRPASHWEVYGASDPESWTYRLEFATPDGRLEVEKSVPAADVIHIRINPSSHQPWVGRSPLRLAGLSSDLLARLTLRTSEEAGARSGSLLAVPAGFSDDAMTALKRDLGAIKGDTAIVETTRAGGRETAPAGDWTQRRFGPAVPADNVELIQVASRHVLQAIGCPSALWDGREGAASREGYRFALYSWLNPTAQIIEAEVSSKMETETHIDLKRLAAGDIAAKARAVGILVQAGVTLDQALVDALLQDD